LPNNCHINQVYILLEEDVFMAKSQDKKKETKKKPAKSLKEKRAEKKGKK
jgi:prophage tail gpP-like protein